MLMVSLLVSVARQAIKSGPDGPTERTHRLNHSGNRGETGCHDDREQFH